MKDWLDRQAKIEKDVLDVVSAQVRGVVDDLLPQIRLAALENNMQSNISVDVSFDFENDTTEISCAGFVQFPPKHSASATVEL
tara:strand:- start:674 stop:922 length:249 start_codon:yes stop_codon:yes gene_type:complete